MEEMLGHLIIITNTGFMVNGINNKSNESPVSTERLYIKIYLMRAALFTAVCFDLSEEA